MRAEDLIDVIRAEFYTGVPDSQLRALCDTLMDKWGIDPAHHVIAANEGNAVALAAGVHLATGEVPVVYLQNSGEGNIINPVASLLNDRVYAIPMLFIIGWRGEPGVHDEPQHIFQGEVTLKLLEDMDIRSFVIEPDTAMDAVQTAMEGFREIFAQGKQAAFVVKKGALTCDHKVEYRNAHMMKREEIVRQIAAAAGNDPIVSTTGKASRELFEIRTAAGEGHERDFLTVGSMGHASSIALGIALRKPGRKVWCIDGDGAALMHLGAMAVIGANRPKNLIHVVINNEAHETVGGMPTVAGQINLTEAAKDLGYPQVYSAATPEELADALKKARAAGELTFLEVKAAIGARADLGRPTTTARENKEGFMHFLADR